MTALRAMNALFCAGLVVLSLAGSASAQDSVSNNDTCLLGDSLSPWDTTEQVNDFVVDMDSFTTSWGTTFGIAPLLKSSKTTSTFFGSLTSGSSISRVQIPQTLGGQFDLWTTSGQGVNPAQNNAPDGSINIGGLDGFQFGIGIAEFSTTDNARNYNGMIGGIVQYEAADPSRLYVSRVMAATNSCDDDSDLSQLGFGTVDASGNMHFRADGFGVPTLGFCSLTPLSETSGFTQVYRVDLGARSSSSLNVISDDYPLGLFDSTATDWVAQNFDVGGTAVALSVPNTLPEEIRGGGALYIGAGFDGLYAREVAPGNITADSSHFTAGMTDHRGTLGYSTGTCSAVLSDTHGIGGVIGYDAASLATIIDVFGMDAGGTVTGRLQLDLPAVITDPTNGETNFPGANELNHYHSQVAFRGGNSQIAIGNDPAGNLLVAAQVDSPADAGNDNPLGHIAVARVDCVTGTTDWTLAGYPLGPNTTLGKPILDGPGGNVIGHMTRLFEVTGGAPFGPSFSAPMIDSGGNIWFIAAIDLLPSNAEPLTSGIIRAVYNPVDFSYELELVARLGDVFQGQNSGLNYLVAFWAIADSNSVDSGTAWSQNINESAHLGGDPAICPRGAPQTMGGMVIGANIIYDVDQNGLFDDCTVSGTDQEYNVLLYIGSTSETPCVPVTVPDPIVPDAGEQGSRYLTMSAPGTPNEEVIRFRMISLDGFPLPASDILYVGQPFQAPEEDSSQPGLTFTTANLSCTPFFHNWAAEGSFSVYGGEMIPLSTYEVQRANTTCPNLADAGCWSTPAVIETGKWGDVTELFDDPANPVQPDFSDISAVVNKFLGAPGAPVKALAQLQPNTVFPLRPIDFRDIAADVSAFLGEPYAGAYSGPCVCPSVVTCGATACVVDAACVDGLCIDGFCRDACARCTP